MHRRLCALILFVTYLCSAQAAPTTVAEFPFEYREGLLRVQVISPKSETPLNFLVDTGAAASVINLSTARRIGLKLGPEVTVQGIQTTLTGYWEEGMSLRIGDMELPHEYLAVDLEKLSRSCERPVDGLLGADFVRRRSVRIDFVAQKIQLLKPEKADLSDDVLPLELRPCGMRVAITINGHKHQWVRLDTGCATALQWVTSGVKPERCSVQMAIGLAALAIPQMRTTVSIGKHQFSNVATGVHETPIFPGEAGLLGNGLLSCFSAITIDARAGRLFLEPRSNGP